MDERLAGARQADPERLHGGTVVAVRGIDHAVGPAGMLGEQVAVVQ
ncbi:hypothetical protein [Streptomyces sp. V4I2]|nr:hypothetical protein [Streptomyces sp. V4I2]MDQ1043494.1 hypothetical protein [Streptomyces sp. V4I2]